MLRPTLILCISFADFMTGLCNVTACFNLTTSTDRTLGDDIRRVQPTRWNVSRFVYFYKTLYMFQTVFRSIIRSSKLHTTSGIGLYCIELLSGMQEHMLLHTRLIQYNTTQTIRS